ncbi:LAQU0S03e03246g1_1 [Lachancea quebecensis]|uniref:LAQU0S03e03246g1_1 n=1 Tax=Lachancea quebecensis TaxID=1654605 RepID=A0A0P1KPK0_9SACH|nr:LAQU0S03e03246g1_1 [Lachancea quebecensis]
MMSPSKGSMATRRSPLKETNANLKTGTDVVKRRAVEKLELQHRKRAKTAETGRRTIEGAVQTQRQAEFKKVGESAKVTPRDLLEWQTNWKRIMRRDTKIYFDTTEVADAKFKPDKRKELMRRGFISLGAEITPFFDTNVTIVITQRAVKDCDRLPETDVLAKASKRYMKVWNYDKAARFLKNLDVDLDALDTKTPAAPSTLSNLLQNEKLYGPSDRDPKARRDDVHYFKYPHVYLYDLWQVWAPIITAEWRPQDFASPDRLPYPVVKPGTFGRCPFIGDGHCVESSAKRIIKRYKRDALNERYALHLRVLYQHSAEPRNLAFKEEDSRPLILPHSFPNSHKSYQSLLRANQPIEESKNNRSPEPASAKSPAPVTLKPPSKAIWRAPQLNQPALLLSRQDTEELADDLCRKKSRIPQEIKASGVNPSNDGAAGPGNGLAPTKASVMNKNMKSLNRLVVDKKFANTSAGPAVESHAVAGPKPAGASPRTGNDADNQKQKEPKQQQELKRNDTRLGSGYCENCRVKYECLAHHINSEKHQHFAHDDINFEAIDSLIEKLAASRALSCSY